ncbi:MAG: SsrA-binding protein SmpB [bacterium]
MGKKKAKKDTGSTIALNKKARHDYFIEDKLEAGIALEGWEVKSLRENRVNLKEGYVIFQGNEAWVIGAHITPLSTASTHVTTNPTRKRKLLLHRRELDRLRGLVERKGYTLLPTAMYWKRGRAKLEIGVGRGKKQHDKRAATKERDWQREQARMLKH